MKYRKLGNSGVLVSSLSLGTMQFGRAMKMGSLDQDQTDRMIRFAIDEGINLVDTADVYSLGESETLVGASLRGIRDRVILATKARLPMSETDFNHSGATRRNLMYEVEASLRRLQTDHIDLYQIHGWDSLTPLEETLRTLDDLVRSGKVRYVGLSNYLAWQAADALALAEREHLTKYITAQMYYSLVGRELEHEFVSFAESHRLGLLVWSPLAGGFLSGKYDRQHAPPANSRFADAGQFVPFDLERGYRIIETVKAVAERHAATPAQIALAWLLSRPVVSSVIIAARTNERLAENMRAVDIELDPLDLEELDRVSHPGDPYPKWMVLQLDEAEDPRRQVLEPARSRRKDLRETRWSSEP
jgi:aryl-alcohol dehydrogenase-like predicted oxidoreductase